MQRSIKFSQGEFYHIYNRGVDKRSVFLDDNDYNRFVLLMSYCNKNRSISIRDLKDKYGEHKLPFILLDESEPLVDIGSWSLMPNHFHFLLKERNEGGISKFMLKLMTAYSMYFNRRHERTGTLFQGVFKAEHADTDNYLKYLFSYIHLNPVKLFQSDWRLNGIIDTRKTSEFLKNYKYSSFIDYLGPREVREWGSILNKETFPEYFPNDKTLLKEIIEWLEFDPKI
jgi:putative transposase